MWGYFRCGHILKCGDIIYNICGEILDIKKCEMYGVKDNVIHTVLPWHGWYLCCFFFLGKYAISAVLLRNIFCRDLRILYVEKF